jgi:replicative DNA helicase
MFIYREEYYLGRRIPSEEKKLEEWQDQMEKVGNIAEIIIGKQRNGPIGNLSLRFDSDTTKFANLA